MSLLTVDQIQYNGGTALTLPTATPAAGDMLQTNGSGVLSWRDRLQKVTNAAGTVTYTAPSDIQAGKSLGTGGSGTLGWFSGGGDPMKVGSHVGWRLADKFDFNSNMSGSYGSSQTAYGTLVANTILLLPSGVNASNVSSYYFVGYGLGAQSGSGSGWAITPVNASGSDVANSNAIGHLNQMLSSSYGANYSTATDNKIQITDGPSGSTQTNGQTNTTYGDFNNTNNQSNIARRGVNFELQHYNAKYDFDGVGEADGWRSGGENSNFATSLVYQGRGNQGSFAMSTDYAAGFKLSLYSGGNIMQGTVCLYYCLNDGT
jgi:hypothetical protein